VLKPIAPAENLLHRHFGRDFWVEIMARTFASRFLQLNAMVASVQTEFDELAWMSKVQWC
jgi:hypothetical protein